MNQFQSLSLPSTSQNNANIVNGQKRRPAYPDHLHNDVPMLPLSDQNMWYYPSHGNGNDEEEENICFRTGNWGKKTAKGARWVRKGKMYPWGPGSEEWRAEERARKRIKLLLPQERRSPSPPRLHHLARAPSSPLQSPYPPPAPAHLSYASFVMDNSVTHTFRSNLLDELEHSTNGLIEGEAAMRAALGRLWQVMSEDPDARRDVASLIPKREEDDESESHDEQLRNHGPDLTPPAYKLFLMNYQKREPPCLELYYSIDPEEEIEALEKSLALLRELQDDGREYIERLQEIREGLGDVRAQRNTVWNVIRDRAVKELQEAAFAEAQ